MTIEQIGQKLKAARESQGLTLSQIWERTKIPMHHLTSMETGIADDLPETVYVAGFIKRYAEVVGLNGQALSDEYRKEAVVETPGNGNGHFGRAPKMKVNAPSLVVVPAPHMGKTRIQSGAPSLMKMIVFPAITMIMLITLIAYLMKYHSDNAGQTPDPSLLNLSSKFNNVPTTAPNVAPPTATATAPAADNAAAQNNAPTPVVITASKHVWVEVKSISNNESLFNGFLESGDRRDFKDTQGIRIHAGNGGSVTVEADGKRETLGVAGKPTEKAFMNKNAPATAAPGGETTATTAAGGTSALTTPKPVVKKPVKKPDTTHKRRSLDEAPSRQYIPGESLGAGRSDSVPYRYTEGRLDTEN